MFWSLLAASGGTPCYYDQGLWWWQQGGPGAGYCQCHHHCQGVITEHSSGCISAANIIIFLLQHNEERNVITFYWHCALFLISQYGEDERSPGPGKCSVRILWHLLTFIPRAPVWSVVIRPWPSDQWWLHWIIQRFRQMMAMLILSVGDGER